MSNDPAAPPSSGKGLKIVLAIAGCLFLMVAGCCLFAIVGSQLDGDFQRRQAEKKEHGKAWVSSMRGKLAALAAKLPSKLEGETKVPAALRDKVGEVIVTDAAFLAAYKPDGTVVAPSSQFFHDEDLAALTDNFEDSTAVDTWTDSSVRASVDMVERMNKKGVVAVFLPAVLSMPVAGKDGFMGGLAEGQLALFDLESAALIAHGPYRAVSSEQVSVRRSGGFRIRRVRLGGSDNRDEAIAEDFADRCHEAVEATVARLESP